MATLRGRQDVQRFIGQLPRQIEERLLRGAAKAGAGVVADEVKARAPAEEVREAVAIKSRRTDDAIVVKVFLKGQWANSLGIWAEYGTEPHVISVDLAQTGGRTARRINQQVKRGTLVINGKPVGATVYHPGARAEPFMRPALDLKEREALAAAQNYINARVTPDGITGTAEPEGEDV